MGLLIPLGHYASQEPPRFRSSAVLLLEAQPTTRVVFQDPSGGRPFPVQLAILNSRSLAETVVESLPSASLQELLETSYHADYAQSLHNAYLRWRGIEPPVTTANRRALAELQRARVTFTPWMDKSGIITISAEASKPQAAVDIVQTYIEALMARTRTFNIDDARVTREFLEQQLTDVKRTMNTSEQALQGFVASHGGMRLPDQSKATVDRLGQTETALAELVTSQKILQARLEGLREKVDGQKRSTDPKVIACDPRELPRGRAAAGPAHAARGLAPRAPAAVHRGASADPGGQDAHRRADADAGRCPQGHGRLGAVGDLLGPRGRARELRRAADRAGGDVSVVGGPRGGVAPSRRRGCGRA